MEKLYPSDITREQFGIIEPLLSAANKKTRPRELDLYHVFCAVLYVLKSGCQWRMLPKDYPKWYNVYYEQHGNAESAIRREKRLKEWQRQWKIDLIEKNNPNWTDLYLTIC